jgi:DNA-binding NtrC family response regulator
MTLTETQSPSVAVASTVLVVEDEVLIRMVISQYLRDCGYRVIEAGNADEAVLVLQEPEVMIEVVLSDVEMPGSMDGFGLSQWVRKHRQGIEVILVGSPARAADAAANLCESGPMLGKPYEPQTVLDHIRRLVGERASRIK